MPRLSETIERLIAGQSANAARADVPDRLVDLTDFGNDPGTLRARCYIPAGLKAGAPLVVALHGCTQDAAGYDHGTGWSTLADRAGFAVLLPEQRQRNNANRCFNWFEPADIARRGGEAESIAQMVETMVARHALDPARVFVTGLSAGGAMTAVMLATWPELFTGGAIIGGLPYATALGVPQALERMRGRGWADDAGATRAVRDAAGARPDHWPRVSIWHGTADHTVAAANADRLAAQWRGIHGLPLAPDTSDHGEHWHHSRWRDAAGRDAVELWMIEGMGHGVPIAPGATAGLGAAGPFMLDVGIASTEVIARGWGLLGGATLAPPRAAPVVAGPATSASPAPQPAPAPSPARGPQEVIERALRAAGLMR